MGWDRQPPRVVEPPTPIALGRWLVAAGVLLVFGVLLFLLYASERVAQLQMLNVWVLTCSPLLVWVLAFSARGYFYGRALEHHQFLEEEAQVAQQSWQDWGQRYMAVQASCVVLADQVSAGLLTQKAPSMPPRTGQARRIAVLPAEQAQRAQAGLQVLLPALARALKALPQEQELRVTLLSDVATQNYGALRNAWQQSWVTAVGRTPPAEVTLATELSYQWIDEKLKSANGALELIVVLQVHGDALYSDGLAAMLLCPEQLALARNLPVEGGLLRPMPLDINALSAELPLFLQTQTSARQATGLLADSAEWRPLTGTLITQGSAHGASLKVEQQWVQEQLCGLPGPFSSWLVAALGVEIARHQQRPLLVLTREISQHWIGTVTWGALT